MKKNRLLPNVVDVLDTRGACFAPTVTCLVAFMMLMHSASASVEMVVQSVGKKQGNENAQTRAVQKIAKKGDGTDLPFQKTVFGNQIFYVGAADKPSADLTKPAKVAAAQRSVTSVALQTDFTNNPGNTVLLTSLARGTDVGGDVTVNNQINQKSPLLNTVVLNAAMSSNGAPVFVKEITTGGNEDPTHAYLLKPNADGLVDGKAVLRNAPADNTTTPDHWRIGDASSVANAGDVGSPAVKIHSVAATQQAVAYKQNQLDPATFKNFVFASVHNDNDFTGAGNAANRGIACVMVGDNNLIPLQTSDFQADPNTDANAAANRAINLRFDTAAANANGKDAGPIAANNDLAKMPNGKVPMWWDDSLQRLYVGLTNIANDNNPDDGAVGIMLGKFDTAASMNGKFVLNSILSDSGADAGTAVLTSDDTNQIVGMLAGGGGNQKGIDIFNIRSMKTTTGKNYLVVNGGVRDGVTASNSWLFGLPLMPGSGKLAKINFGAGTFADVAAPGDLVSVDRGNNISNFDDVNERPYVIGADPHFLSVDTTLDIEDIQVVADTVYVAVAGDRTDPNNEAGIFASTALFDQNGIIKSWTSWQRVAGIDPTIGFGVNTLNANEQFLVGDGTVIKSTAWGASDDVADISRTLSNEIAKNFPTEDEGVYKVVNFSQYTPGFSELGDSRGFSMAVALSGERLSYVQTGTSVGMTNAQNKVLSPTDLFDGQKVIPHPQARSADLITISPLITTEVLRSPLNGTDTKGYLYVGGGNGLARLQNADGTGWSTAMNEGLTSISLANDPTNRTIPSDAMAFKKIDEWDGRVIMALAGDGTNMWTLAMDKIAKVNGTTGQSSTNFSEFNGEKFGTDMVVVVDIGTGDSMAIIATTAGLFQTKDAKTLTPIAGIDAGLTPIHLQYLSFFPSINNTNGNLAVFATDRDNGIAKIYRFYVDVAAGTVQLVTDGTNPVVTSLDEYRRWISPNGATLLTTANNTTGDASQANLLSVSSLDTDLNNITTQINVDTTKFKFVGAPVRDTASGGWIVPGDFGVRVNE